MYENIMYIWRYNLLVFPVNFIKVKGTQSYEEWIY